jgi:glycerophosphoryl diester phosphodiesterase
MKPLSLATLRPLAAAAAVAATLATGVAPANADITRSAADLFPYPGSHVTLVNHRGLSPGFPENTLAAFRNSIALGVDAIEIDMRTTKDGEIVILHDDTVDRTTDGTGPVSELTLAQVKALDAGSYLSPEFAGERIPTYEESLQAVQGTGVKLLLDIKTAAVTEEAVALTEQYDMIDQVIVGPRTVANLQAFKALNPNLTTLGFIGAPADADAMIDAGVDYIRLWPDWIMDSRESAECQTDYAARVAAFEAGERDHPGSPSCILEDVVSQGTPVWSTVNDMPYEGMDEIIQLGATGLLSDLPAELDRLLGDIDAKRLNAATGQVRELAATVAEDNSAGDLRDDYAAVAQARAQLRRAEAQLGAGKAADACGTLDRVATILAGSALPADVRADYVWAAREARRILACQQA